MKNLNFLRSLENEMSKYTQKEPEVKTLKYLKDKRGTFGVLLTFVLDNKIYFGYSFCDTKKYSFDKEIGKKLAIIRAFHHDEYDKVVYISKDKDLELEALNYLKENCDSDYKFKFLNIVQKSIDNLIKFIDRNKRYYLKTDNPPIPTEWIKNLSIVNANGEIEKVW